MFKTISYTMLILIAFSCQTVDNPLAPRVTPKVTSKGTSVAITWNNVGNYHYEVLISGDTTMGESFTHIIKHYPEINDTTFTIKNLKRKTVYKIKVLTHSYKEPEIMTSESLPVRFKTD